MIGDDIILSIHASKLMFGYGDQPILRNLNINVPHGSIYCLLGPSGCGKTTLLRCILGLNKRWTGAISVFGMKPGEAGTGIPGPGVGYMPQDCSVIEDLKVREMLYYFGRIYMMDVDEINQRIEYLVDRLFEGQVSENKIISDLSGGQKRRVSLAVSLIHKPRLLILDEPTVGVDPVLQIKIWKELIYLTHEEQITTLITTHYTDEAKKSNYIGFMRQGQILVEGNPQWVQADFELEKFEDIFIYLSTKQDKFQIMDDYDDVNKNMLFSPLEINYGYISSWFTILWTLTCIRYTQTIRHPFLIFVTSCLPVVTITTGMICLNAPNNIGVGVYQEAPISPLNHILFDNINHDLVNLKEYESEEAAKKSVLDLDNVCYFVVKSSFPEYLTNFLLFREQLNVDLDNWYETGDNSDDNITVTNGRFTLHCDYGDRILAVVAEVVIAKAVQSSFVPFATNISGEYYKSLDFFTLNPVLGSIDFNDIFERKNEFIPGALVVLVCASTLLLGYSAYHADMVNVIKDRYQVSRVTNAQNIISIVLYSITLITFAYIASIFLISYGFNIEFVGSMYTIILFLVVISINGTLAGVQLALIANDSIVLGGLILGYTSTLVLISGLFWPNEALPYFGKVYAGLFYAVWSIDSFKQLLFHSTVTMFDYAVYSGLIANGVAFCINLILLYVLSL